MNNRVYVIISSQTKDIVNINECDIKVFQDKALADITLARLEMRDGYKFHYLKEINCFETASIDANRLKNLLVNIVLFEINFISPIDRKYKEKCIDPYNTILFIAKPVVYNSIIIKDTNSLYYYNNKVAILERDKSGEVYIPGSDYRAIVTYPSQVNITLPYEDISLTDVYQKAFSLLADKFDEDITFKHNKECIMHKYRLDLEGV